MALRLEHEAASVTCANTLLLFSTLKAREAKHTKPHRKNQAEQRTSGRQSSDCCESQSAEQPDSEETPQTRREPMSETRILQEDVFPTSVAIRGIWCQRVRLRWQTQT